MFSKVKAKFSPLTHLDSYYSDFLNLPAKVTFKPLLKFLTISVVVGLRLKRCWSHWKLRHWDSSTLNVVEPNPPPRHSNLLVNELDLLPYMVYHNPILVSDLWVEFYSSRFSKTNFFSYSTSKTTIPVKKPNPNSLTLLF